MIAFVMMAQLLLTGVPVLSPCENERRADCVSRMQQVFASTNSRTGKAVRLINNERYVATPVAIADLTDSDVLIVRFDKEFAASNVDVGYHSAYYFATSESGPKLTRRVSDFSSGGSLGNAGQSTMVMLDRVTPALVTVSGITQMGHTCSGFSIYRMDGDRPTRILTALAEADTPSENVKAELVGALSSQRIEIEYVGYRRGDGAQRTPVRQRVVFESKDGLLVPVSGAEYQPRC